METIAKSIEKSMLDMSSNDDDSAGINDTLVDSAK